VKSAALVAFNPAAHQGAAIRRFAHVRAALERAFAVSVVETTTDDSWRVAVGGALDAGTRVFLAAGGDGTVHQLAGAILAARGDTALDDIAIGGVGLGSSNDFFKPAGATVNGVPVRVDVKKATPRDVVRVSWCETDGVSHDDVVMVSASFGVTAAGNSLFNAPGPVLALLKRHWTGAAILWGALLTVIAWHDLPAQLAIDQENVAVGLTNLSILRTSWLSGGMRYDIPVAGDDGRTVVALAHDRNLASRLSLLVALSRGHFVGEAGTRWWSATDVRVELDGVADLEIDGEVVRVRSAHFYMHPYRLPICGPGGLDV
jgi:diacylglycerol kinase (ATP)